MRSMLLWAVVVATAGMAGAEPFADRVVAHVVGTGGGAGEGGLPAVVLGPPRGGGAFQGATDTLSLGLGGTITLAFDDNVIVDGPGPDLLVFENAFLPTGATTLAPFAEPAVVEVSGDGVDWHALPLRPGRGAVSRGMCRRVSGVRQCRRPGGAVAARALDHAHRRPGRRPGGRVRGACRRRRRRGRLAMAGLFAARYVRLTASTTDRVGLMGLSGFDLDAWRRRTRWNAPGHPTPTATAIPTRPTPARRSSIPSSATPMETGSATPARTPATTASATVEDAKLTLSRLKAPARRRSRSPGQARSRRWRARRRIRSSPGVRMRRDRRRRRASLLDVAVPGGAYDKAIKTGWKVKKTTWTWQGATDGLTKVKLVGKTPGTLKVRVSAKNASLPSSPALPLQARLVADGTTGRCGDTRFAATACVAQVGKGKVTCK